MIVSNGSYYRLLPLMGLAICSIMVSACNNDKNGETATSRAAVSQQHSGTLYVEIKPDSPTTSNDLKAVYSGEKRVSYTWGKNGETLSNESSTHLSRRSLAKGDTISVTVHAGDETGSATVVIGNSPPAISSVNISPSTIHTGTDIAATPNSSDPDGDEVQYEYQWLVNDQDVYENSPILSGEKIRKGDRVSLVVTPSDGEANGAPYGVSVATVENAPPYFVSTPRDSISGFNYSYRAQAKDPDGDAITYSLAAAPDGMKIEPGSGTIEWRISNEDRGSHTIEVVASDADGAKNSQKFTLNIDINSGVTK